MHDIWETQRPLEFQRTLIVLESELELDPSLAQAAGVQISLMVTYLPDQFHLGPGRSPPKSHKE